MHNLIVPGGTHVIPLLSSLIKVAPKLSEWNTDVKHTYFLTYVLAYLLHAAVLLEKLTGSAASQEIPHILCNPKVHYRTHKCPPPLPILSQKYPVPTTPSHLQKIYVAKSGVPPQHYKCLKSGAKQVPYSWPTNIRSRRTKSSRLGEILPGICTPLA
jgi:hypothetical protein